MFVFRDRIGCQIRLASNRIHFPILIYLVVFESQDGSVVTFKDLGPQIGYQTVLKHLSNLSSPLVNTWNQLRAL